MFNTLPTEIVTIILSILPEPDLLECALVCKSIHPLSRAAFFKSICLVRPKAESDLQLFSENTASAHYVQHATIYGTYNFSPLIPMIALIPAIFPNLRTLKLIEPTLMADDALIKTKCSATLQAVYISELTGRSSYTIAMFGGSVKYTALTSLTINFSISSCFYYGDRQKKLQRLLACFSNTPGFEKLELDGVPFEESHLNQLHNNLPGLKSLTLKYYALNVDESTTYAFPPSPIVNRLEAFHLEITTTDNPEIDGIFRTIGNDVMRYLEYIHHNYYNLNTLELHVTPYGYNRNHSFARHVPVNSDQAQHLMRQIACGLKNIRLIDSEIFPFDRRNVAACEKHHVETVSLWDDYVSIENQLENLTKSNLANTINNVCLHMSNSSDYQNVDVWRRMLVDHELKHLTKLDIILARSVGQTIPIYLLQQLPNLEAFSINTIVATNQTIPTIIKHTRLKSLKIGYFRGTGTLESTIRFFEVVLPACPLLEHFDMSLFFDPVNSQARVVLNFKDHCRNLKAFDLVCQQHQTILLLNDKPGHPRYWISMTQKRRAPNPREHCVLIDLLWNQRTKASIIREGVRMQRHE